MKPIIYAIKNIKTEKLYIGSSINYKNRWGDHLTKLKHNRHENQYLQRAWDKYGPDAFIFECIKELQLNITDKELLKEEQYFIDKYDSANPKYGYNINPIAIKPPSWKGKSLTEEHKEKIRQANLGHPVSKETKRKMSKALKGKKKPRTQEWQDKLVASRKANGNYIHTEETKQKISQSLKGHKQSKETREKRSKSLKGRKGHWEGKQMSIETKNKMAIAQKLAWQKRKLKKEKEL